MAEKGQQYALGLTPLDGPIAPIAAIGPASIEPVKTDPLRPFTTSPV
jgi:hypothetical protein